LFDVRRFRMRKHLLASSCLSVCPFVCTHGKTLFPLERFLSSFVLGSFIKIRIKNSRLVKIGHGIALVDTHIHLGSLAFIVFFITETIYFVFEVRAETNKQFYI
jgi:hypothetical protein